MEINTCEQYVLAELDRLTKERERLDETLSNYQHTFALCSELFKELNITRADVNGPADRIQMDTIYNFDTEKFKKVLGIMVALRLFPETPAPAPAPEEAPEEPKPEEKK